MDALEMVFDLVTAIPFWLLIAFIVCMILRRRNAELRPKLKWWCIALGIVNVFLSGLHFNAIFNSGPLRGVVVDRVTGKPIEGVRVMAAWSRAGKTPVAIPLWGRVLEAVTRLPCKQFSVTMITNADGEFSAYYWYGAKVWHGCQANSYSTSAIGYSYRHEDRYGRRITYPTHGAVRIELSRDLPEESGYQ